MKTVSTVCRLARSKSSALGAENRRFKSFHTDQRLIGLLIKNTGAHGGGEVMHRIALLATKCSAALPKASRRREGTSNESLSLGGFIFLEA